MEHQYLVLHNTRPVCYAPTVVKVLTDTQFFNFYLSKNFTFRAKTKPHDVLGTQQLG